MLEEMEMNRKTLGPDEGFARDLEDKEDIARHIRQTVKTFQFLLFEQNRPAI